MIILRTRLLYVAALCLSTSGLLHAQEDPPFANAWVRDRQLYYTYLPEDDHWGYFINSIAAWNTIVDDNPNGPYADNDFLCGYWTDNGQPIRDHLPSPNNEDFEFARLTSTQMEDRGYDSWEDLGAIGITYLWYAWWGLSHRVDEADVLINPATDDQAPGAWGDVLRAAQYRKTMTHELGHALGLEHEDQYFNLLYPGTFQQPPNYNSVWYNRMIDLYYTRVNLQWANDYVDETLWVFEQWTDMAVWSQTHDNSGQPGNLTMTSTTPTSIHPGDPITIQHVHIENRGNQDAHSVDLRAYLSDDPVISSQDNELALLHWDLWEAHNYLADYDWTFTLPSNIPAGSYYVGLHVTTSDAERTIGNNKCILMDDHWQDFAPLTVTVEPQQCDCTEWIYGGCGQGTCNNNERLKTRTCVPSGCAAESACEHDPSCEEPDEGDVTNCDYPGYDFCIQYESADCDVALAINLYTAVNDIKWGDVVDGLDPYVIGEYRIGWTDVDAESVYYNCNCNSDCSNECEYGGCECELLADTGTRVTVTAPGVAHHEEILAYRDTAEWACWVWFWPFDPSYLPPGENPIYVLRCFDNDDCSSNQYCDKSGVWDEWACVDKLTDGASCTSDYQCSSGYCDNDAVGLPDDSWCFTPLSTYFDGEEPGICEVSTGFGNLSCDERHVGDDLNACIGVPYYEDECSTECDLSDVTVVFECNDFECVCDEPLCDGVGMGDPVPTCASGLPYFADRCSATAGGEDRDDGICRSSAFAPGCTADPECNGIPAGTNNCSESCTFCDYASVVFVDADAPGANNGSSWGDAFHSLQSALSAASCAGSAVAEIWVAAGTYVPTEPGGNRLATFQLIGSVAIYGGFAGDETSVGERAGLFDQTILSGDLNGDDDSGGDNSENSYHVTTGSGTDETTILDGFTITASNADGSSGGGMFNNAGSPTVTNCTFSANSASFRGGGMYNLNNSNPEVTNCTFEANSAGSFGGGIYNFGSNPAVTGCTFNQNIATTEGGGMGNRSNSSPTVSNCTFTENNAGVGGGMYNVDGSSPTVTNCTISGNTANDGGGMLNTQNSNPSVTNCTFSGNNADDEGGGMWNFLSSPVITNCVFAGNTAASGGGMWNDGSSNPGLTNCTFSGNVASSQGGGMGVTLNSSPTMTNCIFWGNSDQGGMDESAQIHVSGATAVVSYSCIQGGWSGAGGAGNIDADPGFVNAAGGDLGLSGCSLCIDAANGDVAPTTDLLANERHDDPGMQNTGVGNPDYVDMGAFEFQGTSIGCPECNSNDECDDGVGCTDDSCEDGACAHTLNDALCDDDLFCNGSETCDPTNPDSDAFGCVPGATIDCDDGDPCTADHCDPADECVHEPEDCNDGDACTDDSCDPASGCVNDPIDCDDGDACTDDTCDPASGCVNDPIDCYDNDACTVDACDPASGCANDLIDCDDGDACTSDSCNPASGCVYEPIDCDDSNACTDDSCDPATGCVNTDNLDACNDGDACTHDDTCSGGSCSGTPVDCGDEICVEGQCVPAICENPGDMCSDGNPCTEGDQCDGNLDCIGSPIDCSGEDDACNMGVCNVETGDCDKLPANEGDACDDDIACTGNDACSDGVCSGTTLDCDDGDPCTEDSCDPVGGCMHEPADCDDVNPCTEDSCDSTTGCVHDPLPLNGVACDDGNSCTSGDACSNGTCAGAPSSDPCCGNSDPCCGNPDPCCGSSDPCCGSSDSCCGVDCDDGNLCTTDTCNPVDGSCNNDAVVCSDGQACDPGTGACVPCTADSDCDDGNPCTDDTCNSSSECLFTPDDTNSCDDADVCNGPETCQASTCVSGTPLDCDDDDICTEDTCDPTSGCVHTPNDDSCDDGDPCTESDTCSAGVCGGTAVDCSGVGDQCNTPSCDPVGAEGNCDILTPEPEGISCNDGNACTENDTCGQGTCTGDLIVNCVPCTTTDDCPADHMCLTGVCQPTQSPPCVTDADCLEGESCVNSFCRVACESNADCEQVQNCVNKFCFGPCATDEHCSDGVFCNGAETCDDGACVEGGPPCEASECCGELLECYDPQLCGAGCGCTPQAPTFGLIFLGLLGLRFVRRRDQN